jgi:MarR family transcriptional regulator for hemolysin
MTLDTLRLQVSTGLVIASRRWRRVCHAALINYGVSEACAMPLLMIGRMGDGVRQVTLAQAIGIESASLVRLLDQLCKGGLIQRSEDPADRRAKALSLTEQGRALTGAIETELVSLRRELMQDVSKDDLEAAVRVFQALERNAQTRWS